MSSGLPVLQKEFLTTVAAIALLLAVAFVAWEVAGY